MNVAHLLVDCILIRDGQFGSFVNWLTENGNRLTENCSFAKAVANSL